MTNRISRKYQYSRKKNSSKRRSRWNESVKYRNRAKMNNMTGGAVSWDCKCRDPTNATYQITENVKTENDNTLQQSQEYFKPKNGNAATTAVAATAAVAAAASILSSPLVQLPVLSNEQLQQQIDALRQDILTKQLQTQNQNQLRQDMLRQQLQTQNQNQLRQDMLRQQLQQDQQRLQQLQQDQQRLQQLQQEQEQQLRSNLYPAINDNKNRLHNTEVVGQTLPSQHMQLDMKELQKLHPDLFRWSQGNPHPPQDDGNPVRRVRPTIRSLSVLSALNTPGDLNRPRVQRNGSLNINSNDLTFDDKKIIIKKNLKLSKNNNETFLKGDEITAINGKSLRELPQVNLETFKDLTAGNPDDKIEFNVSNSNFYPSTRVVTIQLKMPPPLLSQASVPPRSVLKEGGFDTRSGIGGKKTTIRRKKQKKRKNTKKRKVMVGGAPLSQDEWNKLNPEDKQDIINSNEDMNDLNTYLGYEGYPNTTNETIVNRITERIINLQQLSIPPPPPPTIHEIPIAETIEQNMNPRTVICKCNPKQKSKPTQRPQVSKNIRNLGSRMIMSNSLSKAKVAPEPSQY